MDIHTILQTELSTVAETRIYWKPILVHALQNRKTGEGSRMMIPGKTYSSEYELWKDKLGEEFYDMATMIRLGTAIEINLKHYYMEKKGHATLDALRRDTSYSQGIFQRVQDGQQNGIISLYRRELSQDLKTNPHLPAVQEAMTHRHLYAHNSGLLDDTYIKRSRR
jgi:hypothetical protein